MSCNLITWALILAEYAAAFPATPLLVESVVVVVAVVVELLELAFSRPSLLMSIFLNM